MLASASNLIDEWVLFICLSEMQICNAFTHFIEDVTMLEVFPFEGHAIRFVGTADDFEGCRRKFLNQIHIGNVLIGRPLNPLPINGCTPEAFDSVFQY